jgi:hypothetical protein
LQTSLPYNVCRSTRGKGRAGLFQDLFRFITDIPGFQNNLFLF